jgi:hypothetical protein
MVNEVFIGIPIIPQFPGIANSVLMDKTIPDDAQVRESTAIHAHDATNVNRTE